jgi:hypothetical protein
MPIAGIPLDTDFTTPLTPSTLLTMKTKHTFDTFSLEAFSPKYLYTQQWRSVQHLANRFWKRWKNEFLSQLQHRNKWQDSKRNCFVFIVNNVDGVKGVVKSVSSGMPAIGI